MELTGKRILVIGGSGVLGAEFCNQLMALGAEVLATARNVESSLRIPAAVQTRLLVDLESQSSIDTLGDYLSEQFDSIDVVVNAAGLVGFGSWESTGAAASQKLMQVNFLGPASVFAKLTQLLKASASAGTGTYIVNISGVVAEKTFPGMAAYTASKVAASSLMKSLTYDLRREGIKTLDARPGHTETGLAARAIVGVAPAFPNGMTAEHVVSRIIKGLQEDSTELASTDF
jgi:cyclic-di-GMP-binding biofilm dispersal mediator protein